MSRRVHDNLSNTYNGLAISSVHLPASDFKPSMHASLLAEQTDSQNPRLNGTQLHLLIDINVRLTKLLRNKLKRNDFI